MNPKLDIIIAGWSCDLSCMQIAMCGRYFRRSDKQELEARVRAGVIDPEIPDLLQLYNVAPTTYQPMVRHTRDGAKRELLLMR